MIALTAVRPGGMRKPFPFGRRLAIAVLGFASLCAGCNVYACVYRTRLVATAGSASSPDIGTVTAEFVNLRDYSDGEPVPTSLTWHIRVSALVREPLALTLRDDRNPTAVVTNLVLNGSGQVLSASSVNLPTHAERDRMFALLASGHAVLFFYVNGVDAPLTIPLSVTDIEQWHRPNCS